MSERIIAISHHPPASNGYLLASLRGPHDVARAASAALDHLMELEEAVTFGQADPDRIFTYSQFCPWMERQENGEDVSVAWPHLEVRHSGPGEEPGPAFITGFRPELGLMAFTREIAKIARMCGALAIVNVTAGLGERAHTRPVIISGRARGERMGEKLKELDLNPEAGPLEDPALLHAAREAGIAYVSVCGHVPSYLNLQPNHRVAIEVARRAMRFTRHPQDALERMEERDREFQERVSGIVANHPALASMTSYAEQSEDQMLARRNQQKAVQAAQAEGLEQIRPQEMVDEVQQFLRSQTNRGE